MKAEGVFDLRAVGEMGRWVRWVEDQGVESHPPTGFPCLLKARLEKKTPLYWHHKEEECDQSPLTCTGLAAALLPCSCSLRTGENLMLLHNGDARPDWRWPFLGRGLTVFTQKREHEREREGGDRQTDRQIEKDRERQTETDRDRDRHRDRDTET